jgi:aminodeoxychorismate synthase component I
MESVVPAQCSSRRSGRVLFESAANFDGVGRTSFVASEPKAILEARGAELVVRDEVGAVTRSWTGDPLSALGEFCEQYRPQVRAPATPYVFGYLGYDLGSSVLPRLSPRPPEPDAPIPDMWFAAYERVEARAGGLDDVALGDALPPMFAELRPDPDCDRRYMLGIERALQYISAGDVYQVNLSRRLRAPVREPGCPFALYRRARAVSPSEYAAVIDLGEAAVLSLSPELFLRFDGLNRRLETRPIKGTRARAASGEEDAALARELAGDPKERAEHLMIVDLERNDLGRVAEIGTVGVDSFARVVSLPMVHHLVSTVSCQVRDDVSVVEILRACFPGGSITGAPKIRAMQIIDELEDERRGVYTGAIGYVDTAGGCHFSIAIRTAELTPQGIEIRVGGGVVADSTPAREFAETNEKAESWARTLASIRRST